MSVLWSSGDAAAATGGRLQGDWSVSDLSIDTRTLQPGALFVALKDQRDGHDFVADALAKGAAAAMVSRIPEGVGPDAPLLIVDDVLEGLRSLARAGRKRTKAKVVGITGSVGKTSTKEMLRFVLGGQGVVHAAEKSFNNHWGVPLTLAKMPVDADFAVIEIGMNAPGEIAPLSRLADLDVAMITTVAPAHLAAFESVDGIAREKGSIFEGLKRGGTAIVPMDIATTGILRACAQSRAARIEGFGQNPGARWRLERSFLKEGVTVVEAWASYRPLLFRLQSAGRHFAMNGLGALAVAEACGCDLAIAMTDLGRWEPYEGRGVREKVHLDPVEEDQFIDLLDDAFNANPASVHAALDMLASLSPVDGVGRVSRGRRIAILGDMLELGPTSRALHAEIAEHPAMGAIDQIHCVGPDMKALWDALPRHQKGQYFVDSKRVIGDLKSLFDSGDIVLVKGSKGIRLARVVDAIRKLGHSRGEQ